MRATAVVLLAALAIASATTYFKDEFSDGEGWKSRWVQSNKKKSSGEAGTFKLTAGKWYGDEKEDQGLQTAEDARFYFYTAKFDETFKNEGKDLVVQFSVKHEQSIDCGGGYIKLLPPGVDQAEFDGESPYNIMFGPDICGTATKKVHVIFNYKGTNHLIKKEIPCESDQLTHVYTLIVRPDQTYEVRIDGKKKESGSLLEDWDFLPPRKIKDPNVSKPEDWVDEPMMDDPEDKKPEGWDDIPKQIPDPDATKPEDWDDESDGEWEAPKIDNPEYKGEWKPKKIKNPAYKGKWVHPEIDNPEFVEDKSIYSYESAGVGFDLWQVKAGTIFDNIIVTDSVAEAEALLEQTFLANKDGEKKMFDEVEKKRREEEEERRKKEEEERKAKEAEEDEDDDEDDDDEDDKKDGKDEL